MICMGLLGFTEFGQKIASKRELTFRPRFYYSAFAENFFLGPKSIIRLNNDKNKKWQKDGTEKSLVEEQLAEVHMEGLN